jgi:hypothetical protein
MQQRSTSIFHYTSIESLALILKTRKIRFSRLDGVDDIQEAQQYAGINFGKYFFVSCWTDISEESIPQWNMYSKEMQGVRIELPDRPFANFQIESLPKHFGVVTGAAISSPLPAEDLIGSTHFIVPPLNDTFFHGKVEYVESVEEHYKASITVIQGVNGGKSLRIKDLRNLSRAKSRAWFFQSECRFTLFAMPIPENHGSLAPPPGIGLGELMADAFINNIDPGLKYIDVPLSDAAMKSLKVRTGPLCSPGGKICVEALINQYAPMAIVEPSSLAGTVRVKK